MTSDDEEHPQQIQPAQSVTNTQKMAALGLLAGNISHDYNNLLAIISGYGELLQLKLKDMPDVLRYVDGIFTATERATQLNGKLLRFSKNKLSKAQRVSLNEAISEHIFQHSISIDLRLSPELWPVWIDLSDLQHCLEQLFTNAIEAMNKEATNKAADNRAQLTIETVNLERGEGVEQDSVRLTVKDHGVGIDAAHIDKVFDPFFTTKGNDFEGLGLSMVYGFMQRCGGEIKVASEIGQGTQFELYFPRYQTDESASREIGESAVKRSFEVNQKTVLLVDDHLALIELTKAFLTQQGFHVLSCDSATKALDILTKQPVDLMVSDVNMPHMNGFELADTVVRHYPAIKILMISGNMNAQSQDDEQRYPILQKPFHLSEFHRQVKLLLGI